MVPEMLIATELVPAVNKTVVSREVPVIGMMACTFTESLFAEAAFEVEFALKYTAMMNEVVMCKRRRRNTGRRKQHNNSHAGKK